MFQFLCQCQPAGTAASLWKESSVYYQIPAICQVQIGLFQRIIGFSVENHTFLLRLDTYSDHRALDAAMKNRFAQEMREALNCVGGEIHIYDTVDLYLAEK